MPQFRLMPLETVRDELTDSTRARAAAEYGGYVEQLAPGQAGCLVVDPTENVSVVRTRLSAAARQAKKQIVIRRVGQRIFFWTAETPPDESPAG